MEKRNQMDAYTQVTWFLWGLPERLWERIIQKSSLNLDAPETIDFGKVYTAATEQCEVTRTMQRFTEISTQAPENELVQRLSQ